MFKDKILSVMGWLVLIGIVTVFSLSSVTIGANQPLTITRGGTGIDELCEGCFWVGESIDRASSTNAISVDMTTGAVQIGEIAISGVTEGDMAVAGDLGIGTTTPQSVFHAFGSNDGSGTTTVDIGDHTSSTNRTCFNVNQADGSTASFYFAGGAQVIETNACRD